MAAMHLKISYLLMSVECVCGKDPSCLRLAHQIAPVGAWLDRLIASPVGAWSDRRTVVAAAWPDEK